MPREVRLIRRVVATAGGWAGDGADWSEASPPVAAAVQATEATDPKYSIPLTLREHEMVRARGFAGYLRILDADLTRRFNMKLFVQWKRLAPPAAPVEDWRTLAGTDPRQIGNGGDFTSHAVELSDSVVAFHLTPIGGNLADGATVELWAAEIG